MGKYLEWAIPYIKSRDSFKKEIINIINNDNQIIVEKNNSKEIYKEIETKDIQNIEINNDFDINWFILENSNSNIDEVVENWNRLIDPKIRLIFVELKTNRKWLLNPNIHSKIVEEQNIKKSLKTIKNNI